MNSNILIIGGAGFIGSHLVDNFVASNFNVIVYDNFSTGKKYFLPNSKNLTIVEGNILDASLLSKTIDRFKPSVCYHLAAIHFIPACENNPENAFRVNVEGTQSVLTACKGKVDRVLFASTGAIYDPAITNALNEESNVVTKDIYGLTKLTAEKIVQYYVDKGFGKAIVARLFNAVGRRETNPHLVPAIMDQLLQGVRHIELGNLYPKRDYIHVEDIADALYSLGRIEIENDFEIVNIGSGVEHSVGNLVELCGKVIKEPLNIESVESRRRKYDRPNQLADISKINQLSGWKPKRNLEQALAEVWKKETEKAVSF